MSFAYTEREKVRVTFASLLGIQMDPIGYGDLTAIISCASMYLFQLAAVVYVVAYRKHRPIGALFPSSLAIMYAASVLWFVGDVFANNMAHPNRITSNCIFTAVWLRTALGQVAIYGVMTFHTTLALLRYRFGTDMEDARTRRRIQLLVAGAIVACNMAVATITTLVPKSRTVKFVQVLDVCEFTPAFKNTGVIISWVAWAIPFLTSVYVFFKVACAHNEGRHLLAACLALAVALIFHTATYYIKPKYPTKLVWRVAVVCMDQAACLAAWWLVAGRAIYGCLLYRDAYLDDWDNRDSAFVYSAKNTDEC
ncbi:hypothetical protein LPJ59_001256 [Coemansia sp. RSA 2399]|nr:hypothetical protein LPJ59_001256 [Coemansia sp. RSA 2399]KAJ1903968.1 hypothetical protein LPJ81_002774 [Coemansia sp. IMI 209127]